MPKKAVSLLSGGMDSTVLAYMLKADGHDVHLLSFDYGQRHVKELAAAAMIAEQLNVRHDVVALLVGGYPEGGLSPLATVIGTSSLTNSAIEVPDGHYAEETMRITVVPNRNAIMLSIAYGVAVADKADLVAFAAHAGDHAIYPDCRPEFVTSLNAALQIGNTGFVNPLPQVKGPFLTTDKAGIVTIGTGLGVPFELTWSCYKGEKIHCGRCGTCVERKEAFQLAKIDDPTAYKDYAYMGEA